MSALAVLLASITLFDQAIVRKIEAQFAGVQFVLVDATTHEVIAQRWSNGEVPVAPGSLVKPFVALAAPRKSELYRCRAGECWWPRGHGELDLASAIAQSCNSYFLQLAATVPPAELARATRILGLGAPPPNLQPSEMIGLGEKWRIAPASIARAYSQVPKQLGASVLMRGMLEGSRSGSAKQLEISAFAKTGTAPCSHGVAGSGDGYVAALFPHRSPRYVLLISMHGITGATAAKTAGEMMRVIQNGR